jgi:branched-chain amino acid transport system ATP-binding protein
MFYGKDITGFPPHRVLKIGLARTFQAVRIYQELTAFENVEVPFTTLSPPRSQSSSSSSSSSAKDDAENGTRLALQLVGLDSETDRRVGTFSLFQQRMLEIASRIVTKPRVLLLDEPAGGLSEGETDSLIALVRTLQRNGTSILIIEHTLRVISDVASRVVVLDQGQVIADAPCDQVLVDPKVIEAYLGTGRAQ